MITNYLKIVLRPTATSRERVETIITFDDASLEDIRRAWDQASMLRGFDGARKIVAGNRVAISGPWSEIPITYESGLSQEYRGVP